MTRGANVKREGSQVAGALDVDDVVGRLRGMTVWGMDYWKRLFEGMTGEDDLERLFIECGVF